jgi:DNA-binding SARP family transcriptional activator
MQTEPEYTDTDDRRLRTEAFRMERDLLAGRPVDAALLRALPESAVKSSAFLTQALGEALLHEGRLAEAKTHLAEAVRRFAAMAFPERLLLAMSALAVASCRSGDKDNAQTLHAFLKRECDAMPPADRPGRLLLALAGGSRLSASPEQGKRWYAEAVEAFEQASQTGEAVFALGEWLLFGGGGRNEAGLSSVAWKIRMWTGLAETREDMRPAGWLAALADLIMAPTETACRRLHALLPALARRLPADLHAGSQALLLRHSLQLAPDLAASLVDSLEAARDRCAADHRLQLSVLPALAEAYSATGQDGHAAAAREEAAQRSRLFPADDLPVSDTKPVETAPLPRTGRFPAIGSPASLKWRVRLFGGLCFEKGQTTVSRIRWKRKKSQELLLYLFLQPNYACTKEQLIDVLQLGEDPAKAAQNLYVLVHQLKATLLGELGVADGVASRGGLIALREDAFDYVDVERYLALLRVADQLWRSDRELAGELYREAWLLYDGLLTEFPYWSWLDPIREYVLERQISIVRKLRLLAETAGDAELEEMYGRDWLRLRPYEEEAVQHMLRLLQRTNRTGELLRLYREYDDWCSRELGIAPSVALQTYVRGIRDEPLAGESP